MKIFTLSRNTIQYTSLFLIFAAYMQVALGQKITYEDPWGKQGFSLKEQRSDAININYSIHDFYMSDMELKGESMVNINLPGHFLPNDAGAPNLPGSGRFIAIPDGAEVSVNILSSRKETYQNIKIAPAFELPRDNENKPLKYSKDEKIYSRNALYPASPVKISEKREIRGVDAVILGVTPFQYNPVTKELIVYRDLEIELNISGGSGTYGEERLRSRYWDPILHDVLLNRQVIPEIDYSKRIMKASRDQGYEYVIVVPDDNDFIYWADSLKRWRIKQGISTTVVTIDEIGGNNTNTIEAWVDDIYNTWDPAPSAILLVGDYGTSGNTIISPVWNSYCVSDHIYADVDGDEQADITFSRITARDADELEIMFGKIFSYESDPPTNPDFYNHPITALGWQTERWFQICSETVGGFFRNELGKDPVRINEIYSGTPGSTWSSNQNTWMVTDYFGPDGLGYLPETPGELGNWSGGTAQMVNNAINSGAFILQHRDHGYEDGWGEPDYNSNDIMNLNNDDLTFVFSINCLTGKYNLSYGECFVEVFHRYSKGALGCIAPTEVSYSFVNDTYVWGLYDNMWPEFMPDYDMPPTPRGLYPSFGNVSGKYFLEQSNWPYNTSNKDETYFLFHHHGGTFSELYSEVPQELNVVHQDLLAGLDYFTVNADEGSLISLTVNEEIIGVAEGTGADLDVPIIPQYPPTFVTLTVTKTNHYRYVEQVEVTPPNGPYVVKDEFSFTDVNGNEQIDNGEEIIFTVSMKNVGNANAENVEVIMSSEDEYVSFPDDTESYGNIPTQNAVSIDSGFTAFFANDIPDEHFVILDLQANDGNNTWSSSISVSAHSPNLQYLDFSLDDASGNGNGRLDPGEIANLNVSIGNTGSAPAYEVIGQLTCEDEYIEILTNDKPYGEIGSEGTAGQAFEVYARPTTPSGHEAEFAFSATAVSGHTTEGIIPLLIGQIPILVMDLDQNQSSGPDLFDIINDMDIAAQYQTNAITDFSHYNSIFVCLGVYPSNHVLTSAEGSVLRDFILSGGNLYMEGADTWYYDDQTSVHPFFKINATHDGSADLGIVKGINGSFTEGLTYNYAGENGYIDHINPAGGSFQILENQNPNYGTAVAYDGTTYKTIGASHEFGGLEDNVNTKQELLEKYLEFFGFTDPPGQAATPAGIVSLCAGEESVEYTTEGVANADYYAWTIEPEDAGMVFGNGKQVHINWDATFHGSAVVKVCGMNMMGAGPVSEGLEVNLAEAPTAMLTGSQSICKGESAELTIDLSGTPPWNVKLGDGSWVEIEETPWHSSVSPEASMEYSIDSVTDASGCSNIAEGTAMINVLDNPEFVLGNDTSLCCNYEITLEAPEGFTSYLWSDNTTGLSITVDSTGVGIGDKTIGLTVTDENGCEGYAECIITFTECAGIAEEIPGVDIRVYPVPAREVLFIEFKSEGNKSLSIRLTDSYGKKVYEEKALKINGSARKSIELDGFEKGIYFLTFENENAILNRKVIVN